MIHDVDRQGVAIGIATTELDRIEPVETYDTVMEFAKAYPERSMTWVFGADSTETMGDWKQGEFLLQEIDKLVIERPGSVINPLAKRAVRLTVQTPAVSSTEVRRRIEYGEDYEELVSVGVGRILHELNSNTINISQY